RGAPVSFLGSHHAERACAQRMGSTRKGVRSGGPSRPVAHRGPEDTASVSSCPPASLIPFLDLLAALIAQRLLVLADADRPSPSKASASKATAAADSERGATGNTGPIPSVPVDSHSQSHPGPSGGHGATRPE